MNAQTLFLSWQHPDTRRWFVVGKLSAFEPDGAGTSAFRFVYTQGAEEAQQEGFVPLASFPDLRRPYEADSLFSTFQNRILPSSRPDYPDLLEWLGLPSGDASPLLVLERSTGARQTDSLELFRRPERSADGRLAATFFVRGIRHRSRGVQENAEACRPGDRLFLSHCMQNELDPDAVLLHDKEGIHGFGFLPRYLSRVALDLLGRNRDRVQVIVEAVNPSPAPAQLRLRCRFEATEVPEDLPMFTDPAFQPLV